MTRGARRRRYARYLRSVGWQFRRQRVLARDGHQCIRCGARQSLDVHHLTYARRGHEALSDLVTLCRRCHDFIHGRDYHDNPELLRERMAALGITAPETLAWLWVLFDPDTEEF